MLYNCIVQYDVWYIYLANEMKWNETTFLSMLLSSVDTNINYHTSLFSVDSNIN